MSAMNVHACPQPKLAPTVGAREAKRYWEGALEGTTGAEGTPGHPEKGGGEEIGGVTAVL